jgi:Glyoxalase-like domain
MEARFGVRAEGGGQHVGQGTHNKLLALGPTTYLEIMAPDPAQQEPPGPRPYGVDGLDGVVRSGLAGWAVDCDDIDLAVDQARAAGFDPGDVIDGHRRTADGTTLRWRLTSNARTAGVVPFLISWGDTPHPAASAPLGLRLESLCVEHPDPESIARTLRILGTTVPVLRADHAGLVAHIIGPTGAGKLR